LYELSYIIQVNNDDNTVAVEASLEGLECYSLEWFKRRIGMHYLPYCITTIDQLKDFYLFKSVGGKGTNERNERKERTKGTNERNERKERRKPFVYGIYCIFIQK